MLNEKERERILAIKESLQAGKGVRLTPRDFLFVYGNANEIFVDSELRNAAAVSIGPFGDFVALRLGLQGEDRLEFLGYFSRRALTAC